MHFEGHKDWVSSLTFHPDGKHDCLLKFFILIRRSFTGDMWR